MSSPQTQTQQSPPHMMEQESMEVPPVAVPKKHIIHFTNMLKDPECILDIPDWLDPGGIQLFLDEPDSDMDSSDSGDASGTDSSTELSDESDSGTSTDHTTDSEDLSSDNDLSSIPEQFNESDFTSDSDSISDNSKTSVSGTSDDEMSVVSVSVDERPRKSRKHKKSKRNKNMTSKITKQKED